MATVGQQLLQPERGWKAYNNTHPSFTYSGWSNASHVNYYMGDRHLSSASGSTINFKFNGTNLRIIGAIGTTDSNSIQVTIDGVSETYTTRGSATIYQTLLYEKTGLSNAVHDVVITNMVNANTTFDAIHIDSTGDMVIPLGSSLPTPDAGWKRYDNSSEYIIYGDGWTVGTGIDNTYLGTRHSINNTVSKVSFIFNGDKLRLIGRMTNVGSNDIKINIDGVQESTNQNNSTIVEQALFYEKLNLENKDHIVEIYSGQSGFTWLDAIDINSNGELRNPYVRLAIKNNSKSYSLDNKTLIHLPSSSDKNMILHGIESGKQIKLDENFNKMKYVQDSSQVLGEGKTFTHAVDMSKTKINKINL